MTAPRTARSPGGRQAPVDDAVQLQRFANAGRLASAVAHELLSALGIAQTDVGFLCDLMEDPARLRDFRDAAEDARAAVSRAVLRVAAVLSLARARDGQV